MTDRHASQPSNSPGTLGKMSRLKHHTGASLSELRTFMNEMRGKSPKEMLGILAQSELFKATVMATIGAVVLLAVFTVLPILFGGGKPAPVAVQPVAAQPVNPQPNPANPAKAQVKAEDDKKAKPSKEDVAKKLGVDETKMADPKKNPLDDLGSDLFKDIK